MSKVSDKVGSLPQVAFATARQRRGHHGGAFAATCEEAVAAGAAKSDFGAMFFAHDGRLIHKWTHYLAAYDEQFAPYRPGFPLPEGAYRPLKMLEIGVSHGGSLQLWRKYFGAEAAIWGIDLNRRSAAVDDPDLEVRIGSQDDRAFIESVVSQMGGVDIVLDDGSHIAKHQRTSLEVLFPLLVDGGLNVVEDTHTAYWRDYGGGYRRRGSFVELTKDLIDDMHGWYHGKAPKSPIAAASAVSRITVYDSMVFIHKMPRTRPMQVKLGKKSF